MPHCNSVIIISYLIAPNIIHVEMWLIHIVPPYNKKRDMGEFRGFDPMTSSHLNKFFNQCTKAATCSGIRHSMVLNLKLPDPIKRTMISSHRGQVRSLEFYIARDRVRMQGFADKYRHSSRGKVHNI